jgi:hypothetical protein
MTARQHRYACARIAGKPQAQAARDAGYSPKSAQRLGEKAEASPPVKAMIQAHRDMAAKVAGYTRELILRELYEIGDKAQVADKPDYKAVVRSRELIGKEIEMFADRSTITLQHLETMSAQFADIVGQAIDEFCDADTGGRLRATIADRLAAARGGDSSRPAAPPNGGVRNGG